MSDRICNHQKQIIKIQESKPALIKCTNPNCGKLYRIDTLCPACYHINHFDLDELFDSNGILKEEYHQCEECKRSFFLYHPLVLE